MSVDDQRPPGRPRDPGVELRILETTLRLLREEGFSRMSIDAVAEAAGVGKPSIYRRWASKADLATAALALLRIQEPPILAGTAIERLQAHLLNFRKSLLRPNGLSLIGTVLAEEAHTPELLSLFRHRVVAPRRAMLAAVLNEAVQTGEVRANLDIDAAVTMLIGSFYARYLSGEPIPPSWVARIVEVVLGVTSL